MTNIRKYDEFINEEVGYIKNILLSALFSLGLNKVQAQEIKNDQNKLDIVNTLIDYNKMPKGIDTLKNDLMPKVKDADKFIHDYLKIQPDKTIVVSPQFIKGLDVDVNPFNRSFHLTYTIKF
jgi:hypothetical protein